MAKLCLIFLLLWPVPALAFCDPPIAPAPTSVSVAREYRDEFRQEASSQGLFTE